MAEIIRLDAAGVATLMDWAAAEGWNPGLEDAAAFHAADPDGFLMLLSGGKPAAAVSVVRHDDHHAFLGLFIAAPAFRGLGFGSLVFEAGIAHAAGRSIGLDAVPEQRARYEALGFAPVSETSRWSGTVPQDWSAPQFAAPNPDAIITADSAREGYTRRAFLSAWLTDTDTRRTISLGPDAYATVRLCREGAKIGPLVAPDTAAATTLITACRDALGCAEVIIDLPAASADLAEVLKAAGFTASFSTSRMWRGPAPVTRRAPATAVATLELG